MHNSFTYHSIAGQERLWTPLNKYVLWTPLYKYYELLYTKIGLPWWLRWGRICLQCRRPGFKPWIGKVPWEGKGNSLQFILAWRIPWTEEPGRLQTMRSHRVRHDWATNTIQIRSWGRTVSFLLFTILINGGVFGHIHSNSRIYALNHYNIFFNTWVWVATEYLDSVNDFIYGWLLKRKILTNLARIGKMSS